MRYLLFLFSLIFISNITIANNSNNKEIYVLKVSYRTSYVKSVEKHFKKKFPKPTDNHESFFLKTPFKKYLGDNAMACNIVMGVSSIEYFNVDEITNYLADHTLQYFFLLFPQHYFW